MPPSEQPRRRSEPENARPKTDERIDAGTDRKPVAERLKDIADTHLRMLDKEGNAEADENQMHGGLVATLEKDMREENAVARTPEERIAWKERLIREREETLADRASQEGVSIPQRAGAEEQAALEQRRKDIRADLNAIDLDAVFYDPYCSLQDLRAEDREEANERLRRELGNALDAAAAKRGATPYDRVTVDGVAAGLASSRQLETRSQILMHRKLKAMAEIDRSQGTALSATAADVLSRSDVPPERRLRAVNGIAEEAAKAPTEDPALKRQQEELAKQKEREKKNAGAAETRKAEENIDARVKQEKTEKELEKEHPPLKDLKPEEKKAIVANVHNGRHDMMARMLEAAAVRVAALPDGTCTAQLEGETVYLDAKAGALTACIKAGGTEIPVPLTDPNATGFDLARGKKAALENGWPDIAGRDDIVLALLDGPYDDRFLDDRQAAKFADILRIAVGRNATDGMRELSKAGLVDENGVFRTDYARGLKDTLERWAPDGDFQSLSQSVDQRDIRALIDRWKSDARQKGSASFHPYTLEEVRPGAAA